MSPGGDSAALLSALIAYRRGILPLVRVEQRRWAEAAERIPDAELRAAAISALTEKGANGEAIAVFAILAPRRHRAAALRAMVAFQAAVDYLDTLGEGAVEDPLADGLALHEALQAALTPTGRSTPGSHCPKGRSTPGSGGQPGAGSARYRHRPRSDDGGYLAALVSRCREEVAALPAREAALSAARRAARRCGEGQSHTHAARSDGGARLRAWAERLPSPAGYRWWEVAAGASSSVAAHALIAAAADPRTSAAEAELVDAVYFPPIGALTVLLDDLVDLEEDRRSGEQRLLGYYESADAVADRLAFIAHRARAAIAKAPGRRRHAAILAGVAGFYLGSPQAGGDYAAPIRARLIDALGGNGRLALTAVRLGGA